MTFASREAVAINRRAATWAEPLGFREYLAALELRKRPKLFQIEAVRDIVFPAIGAVENYAANVEITKGKIASLICANRTMHWVSSIRWSHDR
jgi:hypothetical protein